MVSTVEVTTKAPPRRVHKVYYRADGCSSRISTITDEEGIVGRTCHLTVNEPYEIATNEGDPPLRGRAVRLAASGTSDKVLWIELDKTFFGEGKRGDVLLVTPRHQGSNLTDLLGGGWLAMTAIFASRGVLDASNELARRKFYVFEAIVIVWLEGGRLPVP